MASRGRGRGGFGGRGGRGGPPVGPVARDDDGTVLSTQQLGPPPSFPEIELPEHPEITAKDSLLLLRRNDLVSYSKTSPFFLEPGKQQKDGADAGVERYSDRAGLKRQRVREPLSSILTLIPEYFPEELFSTGDKRISKAQQNRSQEAFWKSQGKKDEGGLQRLDQLAQLESKAGAKDTAAGGAADDEAPQEDMPVDTDEEEDMENDDYYQGEHFDDDEGYDDAYDDGGDEGPTY